MQRIHSISRVGANCGMIGDMKQHIPIIIGITLPIVLVIAVAIAVWIPRLTADPQYDFVYVYDGTRGPSSECMNYFIDDGELIKQTFDMNDERTRAVAGLSSNTVCYSADAQLYRYDVSKQVSKRISVEGAQQLDLDDGRVSSDGYRLVRDVNRGGIFEIFGRSSNLSNWYLQKNSVRISLNIEHKLPYRRMDFLGWITNSL